MLEADRVIIGTDAENARNIMESIYQNIDSPIVFTDRNSAEMIKYASNTFLALKISYINEIANLVSAHNNFRVLKTLKSSHLLAICGIL